MTIAALILTLCATPGPAAQPVLLDFQATWCGPCRQMRPEIEKLVAKGYPVKAIDIDRSPELAQRYRVTQVPTFVVVDGGGRALDRTSGAQSAAQLAAFYREARKKASPEPPPEPQAADDTPAAAAPAEAQDDSSLEGDGDGEPEPRRNPNPWETVVRIKVHSGAAVGFGSGTIIHSTPDEAIILTCAHIFKVDHSRPIPPRQFNRPITVDLFDGKLRQGRPAMVHYSGESVRGEAIDYDFANDVGLIRIRPGRRLPASPVVPASWSPRERMAMIAVGCPEGRDATAWDTWITRALHRGLDTNPNYEAIECMTAPIQGRSGGGLYTSNGYLAGVCDFAEPRGNRGLYASPKAIHALLDRNRMTAYYQPPSRGPKTLLADNAGPSAPARRKGAAAAVTRAQSPDRDESAPVTIPPPELLGIRAPSSANAASSRRTAWQPIREPMRPSATPRAGEPVTVDLRRPPAPEDDLPPPALAAEVPSAPQPPAPSAARPARGWRAVQEMTSAEASADSPDALRPIEP